MKHKNIRQKKALMRIEKQKTEQKYNMRMFIPVLPCVCDC